MEEREPKEEEELSAEDTNSVKGWCLEFYELYYPLPEGYFPPVPE